jgi:hypothetical protein
MSWGARTTLVLAVVGAAIGISLWPRVAAARAADSNQPSDLAAAITDYANSQVDAATAEANSIAAEAVSVEVPATAAPSPTAPVSSPAPSDGGTMSGAGTIVAETMSADGQAPPEPSATTAAVPSPTPSEIWPAMPSGTLGLAGAGRTVQHDFAPTAPRRHKNAVRARAAVVTRSNVSRLDVQASTSASWSSSSTSAGSVARSSVRSSVRSSASGGGRSQRSAPPRSPLPFPPFSPNSPPNSGAAQTGGSGGQGASLIFFVGIAALVLFGIHRLLRKVHWSNLRMPRRGAVLPWRPG